MTLIMLVGLPFSGKSHFARSFEADGYKIFSVDALHSEEGGLHNTELVMEMNRLTMNKLVRTALSDGFNCVYDANNISSDNRKAFLDSIKDLDCVTRCYIMATPLKECLERNASSECKIPEELIRQMYMSWQTPYYFEGWDKIEIIYPESCEKKDLSEWLKESLEYNLYSKNNKLTLGKHSIMVADALMKSGTDMFYAGLLHDCGKPMTQGFIDKDGNISEEALYYNHHNVGGYESMFFDFEDKVNLPHVSALITYHMYPFFWKNYTTYEKYKKIWGNDFYNSIMKLHTMDRRYR